MWADPDGVFRRETSVGEKVIRPIACPVWRESGYLNQPFVDSVEIQVVRFRAALASRTGSRGRERKIRNVSGESLRWPRGRPIMLGLKRPRIPDRGKFVVSGRVLGYDQGRSRSITWKWCTVLETIGIRYEA